jgi:hypothetical protein
MSLKSILFSLLIFVVGGQATSQIVNENNIQLEPSFSNNNAEWISTLLNAGNNGLHSLATYNGRIFSWNLRGENATIKIIDGINWHSNVGNWSGEHLFAGMNYIFKTNEIVTDYAHSSNGYFAHPNITFVSSENITEKKSIAAFGSFSINNSSNLNSIALRLQFGPRPNNVYTGLAIKIEQAPVGVLPNGYKESFILSFNIDKKWKRNNKIGMVILWNFSSQGTVTTTTNEMFSLSKQRLYNPNWGWYHQQIYFPNTRQVNVPVITLKYQKIWNNQQALNFSQGIILGKEARSNLTWTNAADPRPDYYKYLPSYLADTTLRGQLTDWYQQHPYALQIQFDQLDRINKSSKDNRSFYIVNQENTDLFLFHGSVLFSHLNQRKFDIQGGVQYALDQFHFYNTIKDLLGGAYFYNYNGWMNDDTLAIGFQNDINQPNKKIKQGERWGADYIMKSIQLNPWLQIQKQGPIFESSIAFGYGIDGMQRSGFNQNGLFANSKGSSGFHYYPNTDIKAQVLYKINGRMYVRSIFFAKWIAPQYQSIFLDPDIHSFPSTYQFQEKKFGIDISFFYRAPNFKSSLSLYQKYSLNETIHKMFYHDAYSLFVYGEIGNINSIQNGAEFALETSLFQNIKMNYAATFSNSFYIENPTYQYLDVNNLQIKEAGLLELKNTRSSNGPRLVNAINFNYQPIYDCSIGITAVYAQERPLSLNLFRRSTWVKNRLDPITWNQIQEIKMLDDQLVCNAFISKFFQWRSNKKHDKIQKGSLSLSVRNIFNEFIPILAFEQTRFDYIHFKSEKFPPKYLMDGGVSYSLRIQLQLQ